MKNILIYSVVPLLSSIYLDNALIKQCQFLKERKDTNIYALFDIAEVQYLINNGLDLDWVKPLILPIETQPELMIQNLAMLGISEIYVAGNLFDDSKKTLLQAVRDSNHSRMTGYKQVRAYIPYGLAKRGIKVNQLLMTGNDFTYHQLLPEDLYTCYSFYKREDSKPSLYADLGWYTKNAEIPLDEKKYFNVCIARATFKLGKHRSSQLKSTISDTCLVYECLQDLPVGRYTNMLRYSMFSYFLPESTIDGLISIPAILQLLSSGTIPLLHPECRLDLLFGYGYELREPLRDFLNQCKVSLADFLDLAKDKDRQRKLYIELSGKWLDNQYHQWLYNNY